MKRIMNDKLSTLALIMLAAIVAAITGIAGILHAAGVRGRYK